MKNQKQILFILGMHRSGTSAVAGSLTYLGYSPGENIIPSSFDNEKGFYENQSIVELNESILTYLECSWDSLSPLPDEWLESEDIELLLLEAISIIEDEFNGVSNIVIKDPRLCILFPFWLKVAAHFNIKPKAIIVVRSPLEIAASLHTRNQIMPNYAQLLWAKYMVSLEKATKKIKKHYVLYDKFIDNPIEQLIRCDDALKLKLSKNIVNQKKALSSFITPSLNHHSELDHDIFYFSNKRIKEYYQVLLKASTSTKSKSLFNDISEKRHLLDQELFFYLNSIYSNDEHFAELFLLEQNSIVENIQQIIKIGNQQLSFDLSGNKGINTIIFKPSNQISSTQINRVIVNYNGTFDTLELDDVNCVFEHGNTFIFDKNDHIKFHLDAYENVESITVDLQYKSFKRKAIEDIRHLRTESNNWFYKRIDIIEESKNDIEQQLSTTEALQDQTKNDLHQKELLIKEKENMLHQEKLKNDQLSEELSKLKSKEENMHSQLAQTNKDIEQVKLDNKKQLQHIESQYNGMLEKDQLLMKNKVQLEQKEFYLNQSQKTLETKLEELQKLRKQYEEHLNKYAQLVQDNTKKDFSIKQLKKSNKKLKSKISELEAASKALKKEKKEISTTTELALTELGDQLHEKTETLTKREMEFIKLSIDLQSEKEKNTAINELMELIFAEVEEKEASLKDKIETLQHRQETTNSLSHEINGKKQQIQNKIDEINSLKTDIYNFTEKSQSQHSKIVLQEQQLTTIKSLLLSSEDLVRDQYNEINRLQQDVLMLDQNYNDLRNSFSFKTGWTVTSPFRWIYDKVYKNKPFNQSQLWLWLQFLNNGISQPGAFIKQINAKNISTLRKAITNESPELIAANLKRLITGNNNSDAIFLHSEEASISIPTQPSKVIESVSDISRKIENKKVTQITEDKKINLSKRPKVLYISPNLPDYDTSSGGKRATRMLELLAQDCDVYAFTRGASPEKYIQKLSEVGVIVLRTTDYNQIRRRVHHIDTIIYAWYYTYFDANRFTQLYPDAKIVVDSVDVHWVRETRSLGIWEGLTQETVDANKKRELESYRNADIVWAVTENDKNAILEEIPTADIRVVSNIHEHIKDEFQDSNNNNLLFIGGFNHYPNISAVKLLVNDILPKIRVEIPDATLTIAGANAPEEIQKLGQLPGVIYKGFIEEEDMDDLYENSLATISPLLAGAGIKGKICESISYMTPVITNSIGNEGIDLDNIKDGLITDDYDEMANLTVKVLRREFNFDKMTQNAQSKLHHLVGSEMVKQRMMSSILPEISICIVTWNRLELLKRCVESVEGNTNYPYYKIIIHSNGCEDGTQGYLEAAAKINPRIIPVLSKTNDVFVKPNNDMMMRFPDNDVVLLNNDTFVTPNWLCGLYESAYSSSEIGIAGSKILYPDGRLQEFGSELYENGSGRNIGKWDEDPDKPEYKQQTAVGYVSGCSMYIKRSTIKQIGTFDEQFHPCYCEDSDYCYTAWENDIQTVVTPSSVIYHDEGGTSGTDTNKGFKRYQEVNFKKFLDKHKNQLSSIADKIKELN